MKYVLFHSNIVQYVKKRTFTSYKELLNRIFCQLCPARMFFSGRSNLLTEVFPLNSNSIWFHLNKTISPCLAFLTTKTKLLKVFSYFVYIRDLDKLNMIWPIFANSLGAPQNIAHFKSDQKWMKTTILLLLPRLSLNPWYTQEYSIFLFWLLKSNRCKIISKYFGLPPSFLIWFHFFPFQDFPTLK